MIHRSITIPINQEDFSKGINLIEQIAVDNGYEPQLIDNLLLKKQKTVELYSVNRVKKIKSKSQRM